MNEQQRRMAIELLVKQLLGDDMHNKAPANFNTSILLTQPGGMFTVAGADNVVISTHIAPQGLGAHLPVYPSNLDDPRFQVFTGFSDDIGSEPQLPCDDAPTGEMTGGTLTASFGSITRQTNTMEITSLLHQQRGANTNLRLMGEMLGDSRMSMDLGPDGILDLVVKAEMASVGVRLERKLARMVWQGDPSVNTPGYKEFPGLDLQIATGHIDAETSTAIPGVDSYIMDFNYNEVGGSGLDIVEYISMLEYYMSDLAKRTGMDPVQWALVLPPGLWFELSAVWACRYLTDRCSNSSGSAVVAINDDTAVRMRDELRNGMYLIVNGKRISVIVDDGIYEHNNVNNANIPAGSYASSIYLIPLRVRGNFPVTYWEYVNYRGIERQIAPLGAGQRNVPFWTDDGRFLWVYRDNGYCFDLQAKVEPRIILRTPHLAAKLQNIRYSPLRHLRDYDPTSPYNPMGGVSTRSFTNGQAVWAA